MSQWVIPGCQLAGHWRDKKKRRKQPGDPGGQAEYESPISLTAVKAYCIVQRWREVVLFFLFSTFAGALPNFMLC